MYAGVRGICFISSLTVLGKRNEINVQVWRCLIHMQMRGEHVQGMVSLPKAVEVFVQDFLGKLGVLTRGTHIVTVANLNDDLVE